MVNLYLNGGVDSFNLLVPISCALHDEYVAVRGPAALANNQLLEISSTQACRSFGLHHKLPKLRELYQGGQAVAFLKLIENGILFLIYLRNRVSPFSRVYVLNSALLAFSDDAGFGLSLCVVPWAFCFYFPPRLSSATLDHWSSP